MDAGDIALSLPINIDPEDNQTSLYNKLKLLACDGLKQFFRLAQNNNLTFTQQNEDNISFAPSFKKEDGRIDFKSKNANQVINQIRGLVPWPGCFFDSNKDRIKVHEACLDNNVLDPGILKNINNQLIVCLLYTSPSPRDRTRSRMPSSA